MSKNTLQNTTIKLTSKLYMHMHTHTVSESIFFLTSQHNVAGQTGDICRQQIAKDNLTVKKTHSHTAQHTGPFKHICLYLREEHRGYTRMQRETNLVRVHWLVFLHSSYEHVYTVHQKTRGQCFLPTQEVHLYSVWQTFEAFFLKEKQQKLTLLN